MRLKPPQLADPALELPADPALPLARAETVAALPKVLVDQALSQLQPQLQGRFSAEDVQRIAYAAAQHSHTEAPKGPPQNFLVHKNGNTLAIQYPHHISELRLKDLLRAPGITHSRVAEQGKQALLGRLFPDHGNSLGGVPAQVLQPIKGIESAPHTKVNDFRTASINQRKLDDQATEQVKRDLANLVAKMNGSAGIAQMRAMTATEGFLTFNPVGKFLKGWGETATEILKSPNTVSKEALLTANDAIGKVVYSALNKTFDGRKIHRSESALFQSIDAYGVAGTLGRGVTGAVKALPGIAQIDAMYRKDAYALGASITGTVLTAGTTAAFLKPSKPVASPTVSRLSVTNAESLTTARVMAHSEAGSVATVVDPQKTSVLSSSDLSRSHPKRVHEEEVAADVRSVAAGPEHADVALHADAPSHILPHKVTSMAKDAMPVAVLGSDGAPMQINGLPLALSPDTPVYRVQAQGVPLEPHISRFLDPGEYGLSLRQPWDALYISTDRAALEALRTKQGYFDDGAQMFSTTLGELMDKSGPGTQLFADSKMNFSVLGAEAGNYVLVRPRFAGQSLLDNPRIAHLAPESAYEFATSLAREADKGRIPAAGSPGDVLLQDIRQTISAVAKYRQDEMGKALLNFEDLEKALQQVIERHQSPIKKPLPPQLEQTSGLDVPSKGLFLSINSIRPDQDALTALRPNSILKQVLTYGQKQASLFEAVRGRDWMQSNQMYLNPSEEVGFAHLINKYGVRLVKNPSLSPMGGNFSLGLNYVQPQIELPNRSINRGVLIHEVGHMNHFLGGRHDFAKHHAQLAGITNKYYQIIDAGLPVSRGFLLADMRARIPCEAIAIGNVLNYSRILPVDFIADYNVAYMQKFLSAHDFLSSRADLSFAQKEGIYRISSLSLVYKDMQNRGRIDLKEEDFIDRFIR